MSLKCGFEKHHVFVVRRQAIYNSLFATRTLSFFVEVVINVNHYFELFVLFFSFVFVFVFFCFFCLIWVTAK